MIKICWFKSGNAAEIFFSRRSLTLYWPNVHWGRPGWRLRISYLFEMNWFLIRNFPNKKATATGKEKNIGDLALLESVKQIIRWAVLYLDTSWWNFVGIKIKIKLNRWSRLSGAGFIFFKSTHQLRLLLQIHWLSPSEFQLCLSGQKIQLRQNADKDDFSCCLVTIKLQGNPKEEKVGENFEIPQVHMWFSGTHI